MDRVHGKNQRNRPGDGPCNAQAPQQNKGQRDHAKMQQDVRQVPAKRVQAKAPKIKDHPENERWSPIVADCFVPALERPHIRSHGVPKLGAILNQGIAHNLAQIVIYELAA